MILYDQFVTTARDKMINQAIIHLGKAMSYKDLSASISRLSYLYQKEVEYEKRVAFFTSNSPAVISSFFALTNIKCVIIPINPNLPPEEVVKWMQDADITHIAVTNDLTPRLRQIMQDSRFSRPLIEIEKKKGGEYDKSFVPAPDKDAKEQDTVLILRTSGTSREYKFVELNHKQVYQNALSIRRAYHLIGTDKIFTSMNWADPFAWFHGMMLPLFAGATCVIEFGSQGRELMNFLRETKTTRIVDIPPFYKKLLQTCEAEDGKLPYVKTLTVSHGLLPKKIKARFEKLNKKVIHSYGQTENGWSITQHDTEDTREENDYIGRALAGIKYKILDQNGDPIESKGKKIGQLAIMGPTVMKKYFSKKKEISDKMTRDTLRGTWLYTGDIVEVNGDQDEMHFRYLGRKSDMITTKEGAKIFPGPLDEVLNLVRQVSESAGFILEDRRGHLVLACAVVKAEKAKVSETQIKKFIEGKLPEELRPKVIVFTDNIPKDVAGNPNRFRLRYQFTGII